jgi:hypothetical protein
MKKLLHHLSFGMLCGMLLLAACKENEDQADTVLQPAKSFLNIKQSSVWKADTALSYIKWTATSDDEKWHHGKARLLSGDMGMQNNLPLQGHFVADMNSFEDRDFEDEQSKIDANRILKMAVNTWISIAFLWPISISSALTALRKVRMKTTSIYLLSFP